MTVARWLVVLCGIGIAVAGALVIAGQAGSGAQPWDSELSDNFIFVKAIPFVLGLGVAVGLLRGRGAPPLRRPDGTVRRFTTGTVLGHWLITIGFVLALPTGMWQYLGGILDVRAPIDLFLFYRVHYIGGAIVLFSVAMFVTSWWLSGDRSLLPPRGAWRTHLVGAAQELPRAVGARAARLLRLDLGERVPPPQRFTYYETGLSFPTWAIALTLITVTGVIKAMRYIVPVPGPILYWSSTLHVAAMVLIVIKVLDHLRYTLPRWPMMVAIVKGWVSEAGIRRVLTPSVPPSALGERPVAGAEAPGAPTRASAITGSDR